MARPHRRWWRPKATTRTTARPFRWRGHGGARDAVEFILEAKGILDRCIEAYIDEDNPIAPSMDIGKGGEDLPARQ
jgi:hypothetical protein